MDRDERLKWISARIVVDDAKELVLALRPEDFQGQDMDKDMLLLVINRLADAVTLLNSTLDGERYHRVRIKTNVMRRKDEEVKSKIL